MGILKKIPLDHTDPLTTSSQSVPKNNLAEQLALLTAKRDSKRKRLSAVSNPNKKSNEESRDPDVSLFELSLSHF